MPRDPPGNRRAFASYPTPIVTEVSGEAAVAELAAFRDPFRSSLMALQESLPE